MKVLVMFHTTYGHTHILAKSIAEGVSEVPGVELLLRRAPEFAHLTRRCFHAASGAESLTVNWKVPYKTSTSSRKAIMPGFRCS